MRKNEIIPITKKKPLKGCYFISIGIIQIFRKEINIHGQGNCPIGFKLYGTFRKGGNYIFIAKNKLMSTYIRL